MNKEQAIEIIETHSENISSSSLVGRTLDIAIDALKAQLSHEGTTKDAISRQQALDAVGKYASVWMEYTDAMSKDEIAQIALNNAKSTMIRILKELPTVQPEHKVRFADKDHVWIDGKQYISLPRFQEAVKEAQPKEGHWIEVAGELECSECHTVFTDLYPDYADSVACPHCGAKMKGAQNG